jgi:hypothetical protein
MKLKLCIDLILFFVTVFVSALSVTAEEAAPQHTHHHPPHRRNIATAACFSTAKKIKLDSVLYFVVSGPFFELFSPERGNTRLTTGNNTPLS